LQQFILVQLVQVESPVIGAHTPPPLLELLEDEVPTPPHSFAHGPLAQANTSCEVMSVCPHVALHAPKSPGCVWMQPTQQMHFESI
jgi:hypothetical protein